jgi:hypothetical protein
MTVDLDRTLALCKSGKFTKAQVYQAMELIAGERRRPGESLSQAFAKFVSSTDEGAELFRLHQQMEGSSVAPSAPVAKASNSTAWAELVANIKKHARCSEMEAINTALSSEAGRHAFSLAKRADQLKGGEFTYNDVACLDRAAAVQDEARQLHKADGSRSEFEEECDKIRQRYPHMSESKVLDHAIAKNPEAWAAEKLRKMGGQSSTLPQHHHQYQVSDTSGPTPESGRAGRAPAMWESEHSTSRPAPYHPPERPSDTPTVKQEHKYFQHGYISKGDLAAFRQEIRGRRSYPHPNGGTVIY